MEKTGKLVIVGSGIKAVGHFTLEAKAYISQSDIVLYAAADPVTDMWIKKQNPNSFDLYEYYGNDKPRIVTYVQMIERTLDEVRSGKTVCVIFYGHPGVFVTPSHNAIAIARSEGYEAEMLPAVSAEDCLFSDLGIDPAIPGLHVFEATDLLLRQRKLDPEVNLILFQVGCVGDLGFDFTGYENDKFQILVDYLIEAYGPDQEVVNYVASTFSIADPTIERHNLSDLRDPEIAKTITGITTFFIPASKRVASDAKSAKDLGLTAGAGMITPLICNREDYPKLKGVAEQSNQLHSVPPGYKYSHASEALYQTLVDLALDLEAQTAFREDPSAYLDRYEGLEPQERNLLLTRHLGVIRGLFKRDPKLEAVRFVGDALITPYLADSYQMKQQVEREALKRDEVTHSHYQSTMADWLLIKGYATTPGMVTQAIHGVQVQGVTSEIKELTITA